MDKLRSVVCNTRPPAIVIGDNRPPDSAVEAHPPQQPKSSTTNTSSIARDFAAANKQATRPPSHTNSAATQSSASPNSSGGAAAAAAAAASAPAASCAPFVLVDSCFRPGKSLDKYKILDTLGQGTFGKVKLAEHIPTGQKVAIKFIEKKNVQTPRQRASVTRELRLLALMRNPNIITVFELIETNEIVAIVMEYASGGELFQLIVQRRRLEEPQARQLFCQIVSSIEYCHQHSVIHRDLKPENLLLDSQMNIKLVDFGFVTTFDGTRLLDTYCGSPFYAAPEMVRGIRYTGPEVDVWSLGVILYAMLCGRLPFDAKDMRKLYAKIASGMFLCPPYVSPDAANLLKFMMTVNPRERATIEQVKSHPWIRGPSSMPPPSLPPHMMASSSPYSAPHPHTNSSSGGGGGGGGGGGSGGGGGGGGGSGNSSNSNSNNNNSSNNNHNHNNQFSMPAHDSTEWLTPCSTEGEKELLDIIASFGFAQVEIDEQLQRARGSMNSGVVSERHPILGYYRLLRKIWAVAQQQAVDKNEASANSASHTYRNTSGGANASSSGTMNSGNVAHMRQVAQSGTPAANNLASTAATSTAATSSPTGTELYLKNWALQTTQNLANVHAVLERFFIVNGVKWRLELPQRGSPHMYKCERSGMQWDIRWVDSERQLQIGSMCGMGCAAYCSFLLVDVKRRLDKCYMVSAQSAVTAAVAATNASSIIARHGAAAAAAAATGASNVGPGNGDRTAAAVSAAVAAAAAAAAAAASQSCRSPPPELFHPNSKRARVGVGVGVGVGAEQNAAESASGGDQ